MIVSTKYAPPFVRVAIEDTIPGEAPTILGRELVQATTSCITVGCLPDVDGETEFLLGPIVEVDPGDKPRFVGALDTPSQHIVVRTMELEAILESDVPTKNTIIHIWANDSVEPDQVIIGFQ